MKSKIPRLMVAAALVLALLPPVSAQAGMIAVFGDVNSITDGSGASARLLTNLLGTGTTVLESQQIPGDFPPAGTFSSFYGSLAGVTASLSSANVDAGLLAGVDLLFLNMGCCNNAPINPYSAAEIGAMTAFLNSGGTIGLLAEPCCYDPVMGAYLNSMLAALGSTIRVVGWIGDGGLATMGPSPLAAGANGYTPNTYAYFSGGNAVASRSGLVMVAEETIGAVPEPGSLALLGLGLAGLGFSRRRKAA